MLAGHTTSKSARVASVVRSARLAVVVDLDGTLIPHGVRPADARIDDEGRRRLTALAAAPETFVAVVSGRRREEVDEMLGAVPHLFLVAEHGAFRREPGKEWEAVSLAGVEPAPIEKELRSIASPYDGAFVERKRWSVCLHDRGVAESEREALSIEASEAIGRWVVSHPEYGVLEGANVLEVRHRGANKGTAIDWLRSRLPGDTALVAIGDDVTDEDAFAKLGPEDAAIRIGRADRPTRASARLPDTSAAQAFLSEIATLRATGDSGEIFAGDAAPGETRVDLLVISNRLPEIPSLEAGESERAKNVGGLVSGLAPALAARDGLWLGWSGHHVADPATLAIRLDASPPVAAFDLDPELHARFYNGFANRGLWPILHSLPGRARYEDDDWHAYEVANELFAAHASRLVAPDGGVWVHDYHLLLVAQGLRRRGHRGPLGLFLHVPFPSLDLFETILSAEALIRGMLEFDLIGFHTRRYVENFVRCAKEIAGATPAEGGVAYQGRTIRVGAFPLGVDASAFELGPDWAYDPQIRQLAMSLGDRRLVLGVDRLDYSKGIVERLEAFGRFLEHYPSWRGRVSFIQVAVPSRADVPEYAAQRRAIEALVGSINGQYGEAHWVPVRYVYRSYARADLARLYRAADVALVTPLRDGMNLVAKEYVAAQDPERPGVLVLSRFAGAAEELDAAILTNPYDRTGVARDLARALEMPLSERLSRHAALAARVRLHTPKEWAGTFLDELAHCRTA